MRDRRVRFRAMAQRAAAALCKMAGAIFTIARGCARRLRRVPPRYLFWSALVLAGVLFLAIQAYLDSREIQIAIDDISLPKPLQEQGYTEAHVERTLQKAVQNIEESLDQPDHLEKRARGSGSLSVAYGISEPRLRVNADSMNWLIPGQTVSVHRLRRWLASHFPGAKKQIGLSLRVIADGEGTADRIPIRIAADIATENAGYRTVPSITGTSQDLTDPDSAAVRKIALELIAAAWPLDGAREKLKDDIREHTLISAAKFEEIEARIDEYDPVELYALLKYINQLITDRFNLVWLADGRTEEVERLVAPSITGLERLWRRASARYPSPLWGRGKPGNARFLIGNTRCADIDADLRALHAFARGRASIAEEALPAAAARLEWACILDMEPAERRTATEAFARRLRRQVPEVAEREGLYVDMFTGVGFDDDDRRWLLGIVRKHAQPEGMAVDFAEMSEGVLDKSMETIIRVIARVEARRQSGHCARSMDYFCLVGGERYQRLVKGLGGAMLLDVNASPAQAERFCREGYASEAGVDDGLASCIAKALDRQGRPREAEQWYRVAYKHWSGGEMENQVPELHWNFFEFAGFRNNVAAMLIKQQRLDEAEALLKPTVLDPYSAELLATIAARRCAHDLPGADDWVGARRNLETRARKALDAGDPAAAGDRAQALIDLDEKDPAGHALLGWAMLAAGQPAAAARALERAGTLSPGDEEIAWLRALAMDENVSPPVGARRACAPPAPAPQPAPAAEVAAGSR